MKNRREVPGFVKSLFVCGVTAMSEEKRICMYVHTHTQDAFLLDTLVIQ